MSTHQPSGEVLIYLEHNAVISKNTDMTTFSFLHQHNDDKFEFLTVRNLSTQFVTFGINRFSKGSGIIHSNNTRTYYYGMFYADLLEGMVKAILILSQTKQISAEYMLKGDKVPILIPISGIDGGIEITLEPTGCWKRGNITIKINEINPGDRPYHFYPKWNCWYSLWYLYGFGDESWITVHYNGEDVTNERPKLFTNPDIGDPLLKLIFRDKIIETFLVVVFVLVSLICLIG
jgi:hypothetical protein